MKKLDLVELINTQIEAQKHYMQNAEAIIDEIQYEQKTLVFQLFTIRNLHRKSIDHNNTQF